LVVLIGLLVAVAVLMQLVAHQKRVEMVVAALAVLLIVLVVLQVLILVAVAAVEIH
jgi:dolichol kinase